MNLTGQQKLSNLKNRDKKIRIKMNRSSGTYGIISKGPPLTSWEFQKQRRKRLVKKKYLQEIMMENSPNVVIQIYRFKNFSELLAG